MRIASLLPSATEIVYSIGLGDSIVAVTHECDYPMDARTKPVVTRSLLPQGNTSAQIDQAVRASSRDIHTIYELEVERLTALAPDVVLTQSLCEVCAVSRNTVDNAVCSMPRHAEIVSLDPHSLEEMLEAIVHVGKSVEARPQAQQLVGQLRGRVERVQRAVTSVAERPRVFCCEWLDPPYRAGHWVPEQVRLAGGEERLGLEKQPSSRLAWGEVLEYAPEVVVLMPCGFDAGETTARFYELASNPDWDTLPAVQNERVFAVNGSAYFSRPGPRLVVGLELLARILHPAVVERSGSEGAVLRLRASGAWERYY